MTANSNPSSANNTTGHRSRLRKRFLADPPSLPDYELLELLLGYVILRRDTKPLSKDLLKRFGSLRGVLEAPPDKLKESKGFGPSLANFWILLQECTSRTDAIAHFQKITLDKPEKVVHMSRKWLAEYSHEGIWAVFLDNQNRLLTWLYLSSRADGQEIMPGKAVLAKAVEFHASGIILVHNKFDGDIIPSSQAVDFTLNLINGAKQLGIRVLDHLIVTAGQYFSMKEGNMLP